MSKDWNISIYDQILSMNIMINMKDISYHKRVDNNIIYKLRIDYLDIIIDNSTDEYVVKKGIEYNIKYNLILIVKLIDNKYYQKIPFDYFCCGRYIRNITENINIVYRKTYDLGNNFIAEQNYAL